MHQIFIRLFRFIIEGLAVGRLTADPTAGHRRSARKVHSQKRTPFRKAAWKGAIPLVTIEHASYGLDGDAPLWR